MRPAWYPCTKAVPHGEHIHVDGPDNYQYRCPGMPAASSSLTGPGPAVIGGQPGPVPRRFQLYRHTDISHVSGIGVVAWGVQFPDGSVAVRWHGDHPSTVAWDSVADAIAIHGHSGATEIRWMDDESIELWPAEGDDRG
jgi:hypothetical protein